MDPRFFRKYIDIVNEAGTPQIAVPGMNNTTQPNTLNPGSMAISLPTSGQKNNQNAQKSNIQPVIMPVVMPATSKTSQPTAPVAPPTQPAAATTAQPAPSTSTQPTVPSTTPPPTSQGSKPSTGSVAAAEPKTVAVQSTSETAPPVHKPMRQQLKKY